VFVLEISRLCPLLRSDCAGYCQGRGKPERRQTTGHEIAERKPLLLSLNPAPLRSVRLFLHSGVAWADPRHRFFRVRGSKFRRTTCRRPRPAIGTCAGSFVRAVEHEVITFAHVVQCAIPAFAPLIVSLSFSRFWRTSDRKFESTRTGEQPLYLVDMFNFLRVHRSLLSANFSIMLLLGFSPASRPFSP